MVKAGNMHVFKNKKLYRAAIVSVIGFMCTPAFSQQQFFSIGTGSLTGVYYPAGGAICRLVNKERKEHGFRCAVESTSGSVYNVNTIREGDLDFGIVQSDVQYNAYTGVADFEQEGAFENIRSVFSMHSEPFTVVARADADIETFDDLKGKRVNIGNQGSGQRATLEVLMNAKAWTTDKFSISTELNGSDQVQALCDDNIDVIVYVVGHPSAAIQEVTTSCNAKLVEVSGDEVETLIEENPYYRSVTIPGEMYKGNDKDIETFGVSATLVTSADVPDNIVYQLVKSVFENFEEFKQLHPAFSNLKQEDMMHKALSAPLHKGAEKYYKEKGLM
jgi:TRAP transporter TAXI family solute receptor